MKFFTFDAINYESRLNLFIIKVYVIDPSQRQQKDIDVDLSHSIFLKIEEAIMQ